MADDKTPSDRMQSATKTTVQLPAADKVDILLAEMRLGFREVKADMSLIANDVSVTKDRVYVNGYAVPWSGAVPTI